MGDLVQTLLPDSCTTIAPIDTNGYTLTVTGRSYQYFSGVISGSGGLTFTSNNDSWLNATNSYTGLTQVISGNVGLQASGTLGSTASGTILNNGTIRLSTNIHSLEPLTVLGSFGFIRGGNGASQDGPVQISTSNQTVMRTCPGTLLP